MRGRVELDKHKFATLFTRARPKRSWKKRSRMTKMPGGREGQYFMLWRIVDGAVRDTLIRHPDYLTDKGRHNARISLNKRIVGALMGYATQVAMCRSVADGDARTHAAAESAAPLSLGHDTTALRPKVALWVKLVRTHLWWRAKPRHPKFNGGSDDA